MTHSNKSPKGGPLSINHLFKERFDLKASSGSIPVLTGQMWFCNRTLVNFRRFLPKRGLFFDLGVQR